MSVEIICLFQFENMTIPCFMSIEPIRQWQSFGEFDACTFKYLEPLRQTGCPPVLRQWRNLEKNAIVIDVP